MKTSFHIVAFITALAAPALVSAQNVVVEMKYFTKWETQTGSPPTHSPMPGGLPSESAEGRTQSPATVPASKVTPAPVVGDGVMSVIITNHWTEPLSISYMNNAGAPGALGDPTGAPLGAATTVIFPTGWAGRIYVGKTINSADSKIEGSTTGANDIDVSYVDGYSVPITCSNADTPVTGCNIDLWSVGENCTSMVGDHDVCLNPMQAVADGPSDPWFLPCQGAAYTFPNDNVANDGNTGGPEVTCCIGTAEMGCNAPVRQGHGNDEASKAKRSSRSNTEQPLAALEEAAEENRAAHAPVLKSHETAHAHSHLKKHLMKARFHRHHGMAHELKDMI